MASNNKAVFKVFVQGTYYASRKDSKGKEVKNYIIKDGVKMSEDNLELAIKILRDTVLPMVLRKQNPFFKGVRTVEITDTVPLSKGASIDHLPEPQRVRLMGRKALIEFANMKKLPLLPSLYASVQEMRDMILTGLDSVKEMKRKQETIAETKGQLGDVLALNPELFEDTAETIEVTEDETAENELQELVKLGQAKLKEMAKERKIKFSGNPSKLSLAQMILDHDSNPEQDQGPGTEEENQGPEVTPDDIDKAEAAIEAGMTITEGTETLIKDI